MKKQTKYKNHPDFPKIQDVIVIKDTLPAPHELNTQECGHKSNDDSLSYTEFKSSPQPST